MIGIYIHFLLRSHPTRHPYLQPANETRVLLSSYTTTLMTARRRSDRSYIKLLMPKKQVNLCRYLKLFSTANIHKINVKLREALR